MPVFGLNYEYRDRSGERKRWMKHYRAKFPGLTDRKYEQIVRKRMDRR